MAKYYKVERFLKVQKIEKSDEDRVESDWVEVNEDGTELGKSKPKKEALSGNKED
jgi:hypothetical protein|tara:strand:- start:139 stop:303 length:165 start_codon:yes stop_codon:yes gene_type:complete